MAARREAPKVEMICEECGSEHVTRDAWAEWDKEQQDWVLGAMFDNVFCHRCQEDSHIEERPLSR